MIPKELKLRPQLLTKELLSQLDEMGLLKKLAPTQKVRADTIQDSDEAIYVSDPKFGSHKLLCVRKNVTAVTLWAHSDNEEVIFLKPKELKFKPLYLIVGLLKEKELIKKAQSAGLTADDFMALEIPFNDPDTCFFTVVKGTPHCEIIDPTKEGEAPVFYVTEPSHMDMYPVDVTGYTFSLAA